MNHGCTVTVSFGSTPIVSFHARSPGWMTPEERSTTRNSIPCRCIGCTRLDGLCHCHSSDVPRRGETSMRAGSKPRLAICHCTPEDVTSERSQRRVALGSGSVSSVRMRPRGIRASSRPPPSTTSKRMTCLVVASPEVFWSTISEPGRKERKSIRTSIRSAGCSGNVERATGRSSSPPSEAICSICRPLPSRRSYVRALDALRKRSR